MSACDHGKLILDHITVCWICDKCLYEFEDDEAISHLQARASRLTAEVERLKAHKPIVPVIPKHWQETADWAQKKIKQAKHPALIQREWQVICEMSAALQDTNE